MVQRQGEPLNPHGLASLTAGEAVEGETGSIEHRGVPLPLPRQAQVLGGPEGPRMPPSPAPRSSRSRSPPCGAATFS